MKLSPAAKAVGLRGKVKGIWETWIDPIVKRTMRIDAWCKENAHLVVHMGSLCEFLAEAAALQFLRQVAELQAQANINSIRAMTPGAEEYHLREDT